MAKVVGKKFRHKGQIYQNAKQGYNNGGTPPYGYRTEHVSLGATKIKSVWVLGPREEIDIIRWIFNQYAYEGVGYKKIASLLNEKGVPTQKGGKWSASTIRAIIFNESYIGRKIWNKQDYQTRGKKWKDRSEWVITENAHPAIINEELFNLCQRKAKEKNNGGGEAHKPFQLRAASPYWLRGILHCDKCGSRMLGHTTSTTKKYGGQKYYICGGYMRKGRDFCTYVGWRKDSVEQTTAIKLRNTLLRLSMDNQLTEEISRFHDTKNKQFFTEIASLESDIRYLNGKVTSLKREMEVGTIKTYHKEMLEDMQNELHEKEISYTQLKTYVVQPNVPEEYFVSIINDFHTIINLLDSELSNPLLLNQLVSKYISQAFIHRETKHLHVTLQLNLDGAVLYEKTLIADLNFTIS